MTKLILLQTRLELQTRKRRDIDNLHDTAPPTAGMQIQADDYKRKHPTAKHRPTAPGGTYNCHGLTFAARRTEISDASEVRKILQDDDYDAVNLKDIMPGDIIIYFKDGDLEHSGVVVDCQSLGPFILSKWGGAHEVVHFFSDCPYDASDVRYFRVYK